MTAITRYPSTLPLPFSRATRAGGFLFLSGQIPMDADGKVVRGDIREQTHAAIARIKDTLALANASLADVVRVTVWLADLAQFADFNRSLPRAFPGRLPDALHGGGTAGAGSGRGDRSAGLGRRPDLISPQAIPRAPASRTLQALDMEWQHEDLFRFPGSRNQYLFPIPTGLGAYRARGYYPAGQHPDRMQMYAGPLWATRQRAKGKDWTLVEGLTAAAMPAGITTRHAYETLRDELLQDLRNAGPVDVALFGLHGAMVADGYDDCEGDLLRRAREIVGPDTVIGAELDPHCHLTATMMESADLIVCYKEYPHTDILDRAYELVDLCVAKAEGRIRPTRGVFDCQLISVMHTSREPMRGFVDKLMAMEGKNGVLSISIAHGFPWGDTADMGAKVLVYTDGDPGRAEALARELGQEIIGFREQLSPAYPPTDEALDQALAHGAFPVVLADSADNAGGGAPSDATFILERVLARGIERGDGSVLGSGLRAALFRGGRGRRGAAARGRQGRARVGPAAGPALHGAGAQARGRHDGAVQHAGAAGRRGHPAHGRRGAGADLAAHPGHGHGHVHAVRHRPGRNEAHRGQVLAALLRLVLAGGQARHLRRDARRHHAGLQQSALPQGAAAEMAADGLT